MPRTPQIRSGVAPVRGSVGRLRVDAPVEAFGGGAGQARVGAGISNLGSGVRAAGEAADRKDEQERRRVRAERQGFLEREFAEEQAAQRKTNGIKGMRAEMEFEKQMNLWLVENKDNLDPDNYVKEFLKFSESKKTQAMNSTPVELQEGASFNMDRFTASTSVTVGKRADTLWQAEDHRVRTEKLETLQQKVIISSEDLKRDFNFNRWWTENNTGVADGLQQAFDNLPPKVQVSARKAWIADTMDKTIARMADEIKTTPQPEIYTEQLKGFVKGTEKATDVDTRDRLNSIIDSKLASRIQHDDRRAKGKQKLWVDQNTAAILDPRNMTADRDMIVHQAKLNKEQFATREDPQGNKAFSLIKKVNKAIGAELHTVNELSIQRMIQEQGPEAARLELEKMVLNEDLNGKQIERSLKAIELGFDKELAPVYADLIKELEGLSENGKLYAADLPLFATEFDSIEGLEIGDRPTRGTLREAHSSAVDAILEYETFGWYEPKSRWNEHKIGGNDLAVFKETISAWADANNVTDGDRLRKYATEMLFPLKKEAAKLTFRRRLMESRLELDDKSINVLDLAKKRIKGL